MVDRTVLQIKQGLPQTNSSHSARAPVWIIPMSKPTFTSNANKIRVKRGLPDFCLTLFAKSIR
jgi:hypothetical protein